MPILTAPQVERFALDPSLGEFIHTHTDVKFPADGGKKIYSCNEVIRSHPTPHATLLATPPRTHLHLRTLLRTLLRT